MSRVIVFDVNETLLDLGALDPLFARIFGDAAARREWFGQVLQSALVVTIAGGYRDFAAVAAAALGMVATRRGVELSAADRAAVGEAMQRLPPHPDVPAALERLGGAGLRLAALTNSPPTVAVAQLTNAGIAGFFERIMSVDPVRRFKPARAVYEHAAAELGMSAADMVMVAAHDWDVAGAMAAGCAGAFVSRPGMVLNPLYPPPTIVGADLAEVAGRIVGLDG